MRARHMYPDGMIQMVCVLRVTMRCVARVLRRRGPYRLHICNLIENQVQLFSLLPR